MWQAIPRIVSEFDQNDQIRCLVITGSGREAFAAGADISEFEANRATEEAAKVYDDATRDAVASILACSRPVVAAIRGICFGGGVALASACDLRFAASDARFCIPAARLGVAYGVSAFVPAMIEQGEGHVVNTASEAGLNPTPFLGAYHTAKYAVVGLSESLALELEGKPVGVSCLCPELVNTRIFSSTRNAPAALQLPPAPEIPMAQLEQFMKTKAMDPADVAADIVYAVRADRFWIITHDATRSRLAQRNDRLEANRNPKASGGG